MNHITTFLKKFPNGQEALIVRVSNEVDPETIVDILNLPHSFGLLMLIGGASYMPEELIFRLAPFFNTIGKFLVQLNSTVIDGGTDSGVMALMGKALYNNIRKAPYIGVLPAKAEVKPGGPLAEDFLESHHSHFVLVENDHWGSEIELMNNLTDIIAKNKPSLALLVNGGDIALKDIQSNVKKGREILIVKGSGRLADEISELKFYPRKNARESIKTVVREGNLIILDLSESVENIQKLFYQKLGVHHGNKKILSSLVKR